MNNTHRPRAYSAPDGNIIVQASAALSCRRALWYDITGHEPSDPPDEQAVVSMKMAGALRDMVADRMTEAGWRVTTAPPDGIPPAQFELSPGLKISAKPSGLVLGLPETDIDMPLVLSVKVRGAGGYRSWEMMGAELSHPETVAQAALASTAYFGEVRDVVIATLNSAERRWDTETIPAERAALIADEAVQRLGALNVHRDANGMNPDAMPDRDFDLSDGQCQRCPFLTLCGPLDPRADEEVDDDPEFISDGEAQTAMEIYMDATAAMKEPEARKKAAAKLLLAWMKQNEDKKTRLAGHSISVVSSTRYNVSNKRLNELVNPEIREQIVSTSKSEYVRVT